jgi:hypothetical protein
VTPGYRTKAFLLIPAVAAALVLAAVYFAGSGGWRDGGRQAPQKSAVFALAQNGAAGVLSAADAKEYGEEDLPPGDLDDDDPDADILQAPPPAEKP